MVASHAIGGANPFVGLSRSQVLGAAARWAQRLVTHPAVAADHGLRMAGSLARVALGTSTVAPDSKDRRFSDPAFRSNPGYRRLAQAYLVWRKALLDTVADLDLDEKSADRALFALTLLAEASAPTNSLIGNPAALKRAFDSGGSSLLRGARNAVRDVRHNGGMPSIVDRRPFKVGHNVAVTPGSVIYRDDVLEVLQYAPTSSKLMSRPTLLIPPQINKFYVMDLAPQRSFIEYAVAAGIPFYAISFRNPTAAERHWNLDTYVSAIGAAIDAVCEVGRSPDVNVLAMCAGGLTAAQLLGRLAEAGVDVVNAAAFLVTAIDISARSPINMFASQPAVAAARRSSARKGVLTARTMNRTFAWLRPNDLVWNAWVNNYLLGEDPPAFDVLAWNADGTNLAAGLHADFLDFFLANPLMASGRPGAAMSAPVDLSKVTCDVYAVGALTDHLVPWQGAYAATQVFGGKCKFVLSSSGHIQALVNPPGNPRSRYYTNRENPADPAAWLRDAVEHDGTWWDDWIAWTRARSGREVAARAQLGSTAHPPLEAAPGLYVHT